MYPKYLYHSEKPPVIVYSLEEHEAKGEEWKESPAECEGFLEKFSDFMDDDNGMTDEMKIQAIGDSVTAVNDFMNGLLTLEKMKKAELVEFADKHFDIELKSSMRKSAMIEKISELAEPPHEGVEDC